VLFLIGVLPALLTFAIRRHVREPEVWLKQERPAPFFSLFRGVLLRRTVIATTLATAMLFGYWGLFTWLPSFLASPIEAGGAGLELLKTSGWTIAVQAGSLLGYWCFGWLADRFGRRVTFFLYVAGAAMAIPSNSRRAGRVLPWKRFARDWPGGGFLGWAASLSSAPCSRDHPTASRGAGKASPTISDIGCRGAIAIGRAADASGLEWRLA
jgi:predicted secreted protein